VIIFPAVVKLYVESGDPAEVGACVAVKATRGVVTRASWLAEAARAGTPAEDVLRAIGGVANGPVFVEVVAADRDAIVREARALAAVANNVVPALPATDVGVDALRALAAERIRTALGACNNVDRALAAARAGAVHVAVPVARAAGADGKVIDGYDVVRKLVALFRTYDAATEVVAAAIRIPTDVIDAAVAGAHAAVAPAAVVRALDAESTRMADLGRG
jgi:transaldolase